jgi:ribosomal protein L37AE/L43A
VTPAGRNGTTQRPEDDTPFATIIAPFDECANCGSKASENVSWNRTGGWTCAACGESDYPEAAE